MTINKLITVPTICIVEKPLVERDLGGHQTLLRFPIHVESKTTAYSINTCLESQLTADFSCSRNTTVAQLKDGDYCQIIIEIRDKGQFFVTAT